ncbi:MAG: hypothetical protein HC853_14890, partial [Anaerolineae bacterium]|nr:hypothetical protein [Anaerolineae bacterium]
GTNTHMVIVDTKSVKWNGQALMGDAAARIVDMANIVCNRNTIPGDRDATRPSALRFGATWVTQRGLKEADMSEIASVVGDVLKTARPFTLTTAKGALQFRAKVDFDALVNGAERISALCAKAGEDVAVPRDSYPHVWESVTVSKNGNGLSGLEISGEHARAFVHSAFTSDVAVLLAEETQPSWLLERDGKPMSPAILLCLGDRYRVAVPNEKLSRVVRWLRALSDGYVIFDEADPQAKMPGPVVVKQVSSEGFDAAQMPTEMNATNVMSEKPYFIGKLH